MKLDLMRIFDGYVRNYHTLNLSVEHGRHSFTMAEIEYFRKLGSMLGYLPYTEDTINGAGRPMDLSWWGAFDGEYWHDLILHLERENAPRKDEETLDKLFRNREILPANAIGIMHVPQRDRIGELLRIARSICTVDNALLVFRTNSPDNRRPYLDEVQACLLSRGGLIGRKTAYVSDINGVLFMSFDRP